MTKPTKNPFEILGLSPHILLGLSDAEISDLVKSQFRALHRIYHPDKPKGTDERASEINEAYELLNTQKHPESYKYYKEQFLRKKRLSQLEARLADSQKKGEELSKTLVDYLIAISDTGGGELSVINIHGYRLNVLDVVLRNQRDDFTNIQRRGDLFDQMTLKPDGTIVKLRSNTPKEYPNKKLVGAIPDKEAIDYGGINEILRMVHPVLWTEDDRGHSRALKGMDRSKEMGDFRNRISPSAFQGIAFMLTPALLRGSYLFSINREGNGPYFSLEGKVIGIEKYQQ